MGAASIFEAVYLFFSQVVFPTLDTFTDVSLMVDFLRKKIYNWGGAVMCPVSANLVFTRYVIHRQQYIITLVKYFSYPIFSNSCYTVFSYIWYSSKLDTIEERRWTWILVPLFVWPQYQALKLIKRILWKKGHRGDEEDEDREREVRKYRNAAERSVLRITYF